MPPFVILQTKTVFITNMTTTFFIQMSIENVYNEMKNMENLVVITSVQDKSR